MLRGDTRVKLYDLYGDMAMDNTTDEIMVQSNMIMVIGSAYRSLSAVIFWFERIQRRCKSNGGMWTVDERRDTSRTSDYRMCGSSKDRHRHNGNWAYVERISGDDMTRCFIEQMMKEKNQMQKQKCVFFHVNMLVSVSS